MSPAQKVKIENVGCFTLWPSQPWHTHRSSVVQRIGYNARQKVLELDLPTASYRYIGVPVPVVKALLRSRSKGRFFSLSIRGCYPYLRVR